MAKAPTQLTGELANLASHHALRIVVQQRYLASAGMRDRGTEHGECTSARRVCLRQSGIAAPTAPGVALYCASLLEVRDFPRRARCLVGKSAQGGISVLRSCLCPFGRACRRPAADPGRPDQICRLLRYADDARRGSLLDDAQWLLFHQGWSRTAVRLVGASWHSGGSGGRFLRGAPVTGSAQGEGMVAAPSRCRCSRLTNRRDVSALQ